MNLYLFLLLMQPPFFGSFYFLLINLWIPIFFHLLFYFLLAAFPPLITFCAVQKALFSFDTSKPFRLASIPPRAVIECASARAPVLTFLSPSPGTQKFSFILETIIGVAIPKKADRSYLSTFILLLEFYYIHSFCIFPQVSFPSHSSVLAYSLINSIIFTKRTPPMISFSSLLTSGYHL